MAAHAATQQFLESPLFNTSYRIACYLAHEEEFASQPMIQAICHAGKTCYLPVLPTQNKEPGETLDFIAYQPGDNLRPNRYNILEPTGAEKIPATELDLVLVPLVAFDLVGNRVGMGAGYYDRTFAFLLQEQITKPFLFGLAYDMQQVDVLPWDAWDVPLDGVITEKRLIVFSHH